MTDPLDRLLSWRPRNPIALLFHLRMSLAVAYAVVLALLAVLS